MKFPPHGLHTLGLLALALLAACSRPPTASNAQAPQTAPTSQTQAVAPAASAPEPAATTALPELQDGSFYRVCSYNVRNWCITDRVVNGQRKDAAPKPDSEKQAVLAILKNINPDILTIEEMGADPAMAQDFIQALGEAGLSYPHSFHSVGMDKRIAILVLSRFPIAQSTAVQEVQENGQRVGFAPGRAFADVTIMVSESYRLELLAAHLKSKRPTDGGPSEADIRLGEARALRTLMNQKLGASPNLNLLVVGDMNDFWQSPPIKALMGESRSQGGRMFDLWLRDYLGDRWTHFYTPEQTYARLDYMFASRGLFQEYMAEHSYIYREERGDGPNLQWSSASDHRPAIATFHATDQTPRK
jgi:predicted extracellular nuclease